MRQRRIAVIAVALALAVVGARVHPVADIELLTHDARDAAPHRLEAAVNLGMLGVKLVYTWTGRVQR
jgi:hypothetical protein